MNYRSDIDGLRAIAVLVVIAYHAFPGKVPGGFVGVDVFFVISGFLITGIILRGLEHDRFSFVAFYARRARRIFPALILVLTTCLVFGWVALLPDEYEHLGKHVTAGMALISNFALWRESGYFDAEAALKPLLHLWSLGIEEQFYIAWPLVLVLLCHAGKPGAAIAGIAGISFVLNIAFVYEHPVATFYSPATRAWSLMVGALLACRPFTLRPVVENISAMAGVALITGSAFLFSASLAYPGWWALAPTLGAAMIVSSPGAWVNRRLLSMRPAVFIGLISFPLYLWHWPILSFLNILGPDFTRTNELFAVRFAGILLSILLAWLSYEYLEKRIRYAPVTPYVAATAVAVLLGGATVFTADGFIGRTRFASDPFRVAESNMRSRACATYFGIQLVGSDYCVIVGDVSRSIDILVGDSHANGLFPALASRGAAQLGTPGCFPAAGDDYCGRGMDKALRVAAENPRVRRVYLAAQWSHYFEILGEKAFRAGLARTLERLSGKEVYFVQQIPELDFNPKDCARVRPINFYRTTRSSCNIAASQVDALQATYRAAVSDLLSKYPAVRVIDPVPFLCDRSVCEAIQNGAILYRNRDHLSLEGGLLLKGIF